MNDIVKEKRDLAQTYLIIATLITAFKTNIDFQVDNATTYTISEFNNTVFFAFIALVLLYYITIPSIEENDPSKKNFISILSKVIALIFSAIVYLCLVEPIIINYPGSGINTVFAFVVFVVFLVLLVGFTTINAVVLENKYSDLMNHLTIDFKILIIAAIQNVWLVSINLHVHRPPAVTLSQQFPF
jgi:hypothetical protein